MKNIITKIASFKKQLTELKEQHDKSIQSVKEARKGNYFNSFTDTCKQVLCILEGEVFAPYSMGGWCSRFKLNQASKWIDGGFTYYKYCYIYKIGDGHPIGIIAPKDELFNAIGRYQFEEMWRKRVKHDSREIRGFGEFCEALKKDHNFLIETVENHYGLKHQVYKNRSLKIPELFVIMFR